MMKLEGEIGEINVIERLVELGREQFTGAVRFENDGIIKIIYFKGGDLLSASTNDRADSVDEILLRAGKVTREHVKQALARRKENETLGDALLNLGFITRKELTWGRRMQAIGVIRSVAAWGQGSYTMVADYLPKREEGTLFPLSQMLVEMIVTDPDREKIEQALEGGNVVYEKTADFDEAFRGIGLNQDADEIVSHVDGHRSAGEIAGASGKDEFNVYKLLHALATLGLLRHVGHAPSEPDDAFDTGDAGFAGAGVADAEDLWSTEATPVLNPLEEPPTVVIPAALSFGATEPIERPALDMPEMPPPAAASSHENPLWDDEPLPMPVAPPIAPHLEPPPEEQWGFDEAQIETARRASVFSPEDEITPMSEIVEEASKPNRWVGLLIGAALLIALAIGGLAAWNRWQGDTTTTAAQLTPAAARARRHGLRPGATSTLPAGVPEASSSAGTASSGSTGTETVETMGTIYTTEPPATGTETTPPAPTAVQARPGNEAAQEETGTPGPLRLERTPAGKPVLTNVIPKPAPTPPATKPPTPPAHPAPQVPSMTPVQRAAGGTKAPTAAAEVSTPKTAPAPVQVVAAPPKAAPPQIAAAGEKPVAASVQGEAIRSHYDEMARAFARQPTGAYTVQFELSCQTASITKALTTGGSNVWFVPTTYRSQGCFRVFWGHYATADEAKQAISQIPVSLREGVAPVVVRVPK